MASTEEESRRDFRILDRRRGGALDRRRGRDKSTRGGVGTAEGTNEAEGGGTKQRRTSSGGIPQDRKEQHVVPYQWYEYSRG